MKKTLRFFLLVCITAVMTGCKLAVIVVEGGEVQSVSSGICIASAICIVDVNDPNFSETFTAVPFKGWYFEKWNSGDRFFCGGSFEPNCTLSFEGHEDSRSVEDMVASSEMFYLMPVFKEAMNVVEVDGREWLQPALFTGVSWSEINAVCPEGECIGVLSGINLNGWKWASADDINTLFNHYIGSDVLGPGPDDYRERNSEWAPAFFSEGWISNVSHPSYPSVMETKGWIRDLKTGTEEAFLAIIIDFPSELENEVLQDGASTLGDHTASDKGNGAWFYRTP